MGKKLFKFFSEAAARPGASPEQQLAKSEGAAAAGEKMRQLIQREYGPEQVAMLRELAGGAETATRYGEEETTIRVEDVVAPQADMLEMITEQTGLEMIQLKDYPRAHHKIRSLITPDQAKTMKVVPLAEDEDSGAIIVAIADPSNPTIADDLRLILGRDVITKVAREDEISERIEQYYGMEGESLEDVLDQQSKEEGDENVIANNAAVDLSDPEALANAAPIIKLVNVMLLRAISERASDIHIEPFPTFIRVRYRVDGVLREIPSPPRNQLVAIVSRVKVLANMNISETRLPQSGRIKTVMEGREVDIRVSSVPTVHGESVVMRILDKSMMNIGISNIGMLPEVLEPFMRLIRRPNGIVLVTGPTGCGKTTTLYAALAEVQDPGEKLITNEDPVEYELAGVQQVNINDAVGMTYARSLRAILRQDPDTILVGEIRDVETAQISVQAALTGHLVFSTLHTNSACATVTRLLDMGCEPFLITSSLQGVIGQRLVRSICPSCKVPFEADEFALMDFDTTPEEVRAQGLTFYHGEGCGDCNHSGYRGRMGIFELLEINDEMRELILERGTTDELQELALRAGMVTMRRDGWMKAALGVTTLSEVARQTPRDTVETTPSAPEEKAEAKEQIEQPQAQPQALPKPQPKLDEKTMGVESEAAMPVYQAGDSQKA